MPRFQFSLARLLVAMGLLAMAGIFASQPNEWALLAIPLVGVGVGSLFDNVKRGIVIGILAGLILPSVFLYALIVLSLVLSQFR